MGCLADINYYWTRNMGKLYMVVLKAILLILHVIWPNFMGCFTLSNKISIIVQEINLNLLLIFLRKCIYWEIDCTPHSYVWAISMTNGRLWVHFIIKKKRFVFVCIIYYKIWCINKNLVFLCWYIKWITKSLILL